MYRELAPMAVQRRLHDLQRHRGAYIVPGPNFIWSIDGYLKLAPYGIEIYAAIDAYSRYIIWIYVGISSRTAVSVLRQFLDTLQITEQLPRFVRSDRGTETTLLAAAQHKLQQSQHPEIQISECYLYGTSTANQRIEAWWLQLTKGVLFRYRVCACSTNNTLKPVQSTNLYIRSFSSVSRKMGDIPRTLFVIRLLYTQFLCLCFGSRLLLLYESGIIILFENNQTVRILYLESHS
jgi:hypothetical protein